MGDNRTGRKRVNTTGFVVMEFSVPYADPRFVRAEELKSLQRFLKCVLDDIVHQKDSGGTTGELLIISNFQNPETVCRLHKQLDCGGPAGNAEESQPESAEGNG